MKKKKEKGPVVWLLSKIKKRVPLLVCITVIAIVQAILNVEVAVLSKNVLDLAKSGTAKEEFLPAAFWLIGVVVAILFFSYLIRQLSEKLRIELDRDWKKELFSRILNGEFASVSGYHSGELVNRLTNDVRRVSDGIVGVLPEILSMVTRLVFASIVMFELMPTLTLIILGLGLLILLVTTSFRRYMKNLHKKVAEADGVTSSFLQEGIEKLLMVQSMNVEKEMEERADALLSDRFRIQNRRKNFSILGSTGISLIFNLIYYGSMIFCAFEMFQNHITVGTLVAVTQLVGKVQGPFAGISSVASTYLSMVASAERLRELCSMPLQERSEEAVPDFSALFGENVVFTYSGDEAPTIDGLNFEVQKGSFTCITGESGAGKSTLLKLLLGIFPVDRGKLFVKTSGGNTVDLCRKTCRIFSYVPQGNLLLSGTLRENLLLSKPDATEEELRKAIYVSGLSEMVEELPEGLLTKIGENALGISEGQAQRVSIARAILRDAPVILLDEATSALDAQTEQTVLERIKELGKTVIFVTHREAAMQMADRRISF